MGDLNRMSDVFKLLGDRTRLQLVALVHERELCVCELAELLETSQPNISQHIRKLKDAGLIQESRRGKWVYYSLSQSSSEEWRTLLPLLPSQKEKLKAFKPIACCD
jgi:ArsR family transcriptional regulator